VEKQLRTGELTFVRISACLIGCRGVVVGCGWVCEVKGVEEGASSSNSSSKGKTPTNSMAIHFGAKDF